MKPHVVKRLAAAAALLLTVTTLWSGPSWAAPKGSRWGANYFPNVPLTTQDGESVRFYDDVIKDKVVAINFIFTNCMNSCPLETARMAKVKQILGDRVGKDIFMYSITIDPERDTPEVLKEYTEKYRTGPGWTFLTGKKEDITLLRRKLGLYIADIQGDDNDHNLNLIIGNESTGRWMKRSPFENPYVLATQLGSWLHNWKKPESTFRDYADAPKVRKISQGETLYRTRCESCHSIGEGDGIGPDLLGVTQRREQAWLVEWLKAPEKMIEAKDPIAISMYEQYQQLVMPNMQLNELDIADLLDFLTRETERIQQTPNQQARQGQIPGESPL